MKFQGIVWPAAALSFLVWFVAAASASFWGLRLWPQASTFAPAPSLEAARALPALEPLALARSLGASPQARAAQPAAPRLETRLTLQGVVAPAFGQSNGAALIAVDGKPAKPFRPGATVVDDTVLRALAPRRAVLQGAQGEFTLELARNAAPGLGGPAAMRPPPPVPSIAESDPVRSAMEAAAQTPPQPGVGVPAWAATRRAAAAAAVGAGAVAAPRNAQGRDEAPAAGAN